MFDLLRFQLERLLLRGVGHRLLLAAAVIAGVSVVAGVVAALLVPDLPDAAEATWWAFLRLSDPGYLGDDEGTTRRVISTIVTVLGYVIFLGLLVAILTQWMNETIERLESGVTPVRIKHHIVVLGWTHRTPLIVENLLRSGPRARRFMRRVGARTLRVVILSERVDAALLSRLRDHLKELWDDRVVLVRMGTPLRLEHLERVAFRDAAAIVLPGADFAEQSPDVADAETLKTLASVSRHAQAARETPPLAIAGLTTSARAAVVQSVYGGDVETVAADEVLSRLMVWSLRRRGVWSVLRSLLTTASGSSLHVRAHPALDGQPFGSLHARFRRALVVGIVPASGARTVLNAASDRIVHGDDLLVFVAEHLDACVPGPPVTLDPLPPAELPLGPVVRVRRSVLVIGWARKVPALLRELAHDDRAEFHVDVIANTPVADREAAVGGTADSTSGVTVRQIAADPLAPDLLDRYDPTSYEHIVLLARERLEDVEHADAATVATCLSLRRHIPDGAAGPSIHVEILGPDNAFLVERDDVEVLVSPRVASHVLSQIALRRELAGVYSELLGAEGAQVAMIPAKDVLPRTEGVTFEDCQRAAAARGCVGLGFRLGSQPGSPVHMNPDREREWRLVEGDEVILLVTPRTVQE